MMTIRLNELLELLVRNAAELCECDVSTCIRCAAKRYLNGKNVIQINNKELYHRNLNVFISVRNEGRAGSISHTALRESLVSTCSEESRKARFSKQRQEKRKERILHHVPVSVSQAVEFDAWIEPF